MRDDSITLPTAPFRRRHRELLAGLDDVERVADRLFGFDQGVASQQLYSVIDFLQARLLTQVIAEGEALYPILERVVGSSEATELMRMERAELSSRVERLQNTVAEALDVWPDRQLAASIVAQIHSLVALIRLHCRKKSEVLFPILDSAITVDEVSVLFEGASGRQ